MFILQKCQKRPRENRANGLRDGNGRKYASLARFRKCRMKAGTRFPRHFAPLFGMPCGTDTSPASANREKDLQKDRRVLCADGLQIKGKKPSDASFSPSFRTLVGHFAERKGFLCGKKCRFCRTKTGAKAEKRSIRAILPPIFLHSRSCLCPVASSRERETGRNPFLFDRKSRL